MNQLQYERIGIFLFCRPNKLEHAIKKFFNFFWCGRRNDFVWQKCGISCLESKEFDRIGNNGKKKRDLKFSPQIPLNIWYTHPPSLKLRRTWIRLRLRFAATRGFDSAKRCAWSVFIALRRDPASLHYAATSKHADIEKPSWDCSQEG